MLDGRLNPKVRIVGVVIDDASVAYPLPSLAEAGVVNDEVGGEPIVLLWAPGTVAALGSSTVAGGEEVGSAVVFSRSVDGQTLEFTPADEGTTTDVATGSTWNLDGAAIDGPMEGSRLDRVPKRPAVLVRLGHLPPRHLRLGTVTAL